MTLSAGGIGSGLDINGIIGKLMELERRPLVLLREQGSDFKAQLSAFGQLKSAVSTFQDAMKNLSVASKFNVYTATSTSNTTFTASANSTATAGTYTINVSSLAAAEKQVSNNGFVDGNTSIGQTGTVDISVAGSVFSVSIDVTNNTLNGIRDAINNATDNTGVTASVINTGTNSRLVLTANNVGAANTITITDATPAGLNKVVNALGGFTTTQTASDASVTIDGIAVTSSSNTITGAIAGVTIDLVSATGVNETLTVSRDMTATKDHIQTFVDAYNSLKATLDTLGGKDATLESNSAILSIERQMRSILNTPASGLGYSYLAEIGITTDSKTGNLQLDSAKLDSALASNSSAVTDLFSNNNQGFAYRLDQLAGSMVATNGLIDIRKDGIQASIDQISDREQFLEYRMTQIEDRLVAQFSAMDSLVASLNATGDYLMRQLAQLPGMVKKS